MRSALSGNVSVTDILGVCFGDNPRSCLFGFGSCVRRMSSLRIGNRRIVARKRIKETRLADRYVTVKGLVERTVKSTFERLQEAAKNPGAIAGNELVQVEKQREAARSLSAEPKGGYTCGTGEVAGHQGD
jgi:hypothetical protein